MYKVFVNDKVLILSDKSNPYTELTRYPLKNKGLKDILQKLEKTPSRGFYIYDKNLEFLWEQFKREFLLLTAAGGIVINDKREVLIIFRNKHWDLPKGKKEADETLEQTALREVEEECSVFDIKIIKALKKTYHIYTENDKKILKTTHWFLMKTTYQKAPVPQKEESILKAKFVPLGKMSELYDGMYANIRELLEKYLNNKMFPA